MRVWGGTADISLGWMFEMWGKRKPIVSGLEIPELLGQTVDQKTQRKELASEGISYKVIKANGQISSEQDPGRHSMYQSSILEAGILTFSCLSVFDIYKKNSVVASSPGQK